MTYERMTEYPFQFIAVDSEIGIAVEKKNHKIKELESEISIAKQTLEIVNYELVEKSNHLKELEKKHSELESQFQLILNERIQELESKTEALKTKVEKRPMSYIEKVQSKEIDMGPIHYSILSCIRKNPGITNKQLVDRRREFSSHTFIEIQTAHKYLSNLKRCGLIVNKDCNSGSWFAI
jgi:uncharacterized coiled-coil protein SlyX